jgi:PIN domain nuclease of toxin-antitoxin system
VKLLLDTHIWVWSLVQPGKLTQAVRRELQRSRNELYLSPISVWEAGQIAHRGKLHGSANFAEWLDRAFAQTPVREAPFNFEVAKEACRIRLPQNDPGNLFVAATASAFGLTLVTVDPKLLACSWLETLAND